MGNVINGKREIMEDRLYLQNKKRRTRGRIRRWMKFMVIPLTSFIP